MICTVSGGMQFNSYTLRVRFLANLMAMDVCESMRIAATVVCRIFSIESQQLSLSFILTGTRV